MEDYYNMFKSIPNFVRDRDAPGMLKLLRKHSHSEYARYLLSNMDPDDPLFGLSTAPFDPDILYEYVYTIMERMLEDSPSTLHYAAWKWSHVVETSLLGYRRASQERFFSLAIDAVRHAFVCRDIDRGITDGCRDRLFKSWGSVRDGIWTNMVAPAGRITTPALDIVALGGGDDELLEKCMEAVEEFSEDFFVSADGEEGLYRRPFRDDWEPLNHALSMGRALLRLHRLTGLERYGTMARQLAAFFKRSLILEEGDRYAWGYRPNLKNRRRGFPTTFWKADIDLSFVVDCVQDGIVFDENDVARFARTFKHSVLRTDFLNCRVSIEKPVSVRDKAVKVGNRVYGLCGWMVLAPFDGEIEEAIEGAMTQHADIMPGGWFAQPRAALGYAYKSTSGRGESWNGKVAVGR